MIAIDLVAYERAPRYVGRSVNRRIVCADGFKVSIQASSSHYANDITGESPYWRLDGHVAYPFTTFEIGNPSDEPGPAEVWDEYESGGVWESVPRQVVVDLLELHGGAVRWEEPE